MTEIRRLSLLALGVAGTALVAAGCSSSSTTPAPAASSAVPESGTTTATSGSLPAAPSGAKELSAKSEGGVEYARYQISGTSPEQVISDYSDEAKASGYTVTDTGSGGGGWGGWGGAGAGMEGSMSGSYLNVQAGGESGGPTYFEVCMGADQSAVDQCEQQSQNEQQNQNQNDSKSGGS